MKKIILASVFTALTYGTYAQGALDTQLRDAQCKSSADEIAKGEKNTADPKKGLKSANWVKLAEAYMDGAMNCGKDSLASEKAYNTYLKALEIEKAAGGKGVKDIEAALTGQKLHQTLMSQGANFYNGKNLNGAYKLFNLATVVNPKDSTSALYAGIAAQQTGNNDGAAAAFNKYLENGGKDVTVFYSLAQIYKAQKNTAKAIEILKKGIAVTGDKDLKGELVNINLSSGNSDEAINELKKLVDSDPSNINNMLNLGILYDNSGKKEEAMNWYKKVLEKEPNNYDCNFNIGVMYFNQAVEMKKEVDKMDMKTYQKEGKAVEDKVCAKFNEAKTYFDVCKKVKPNDEDLKGTYDGLVGVLDQCSKRK